jgi:tetratricopeptide (TPR) repeat protein
MNRDQTLRRAEKLLRQGRLDAAIAEYEGIVEVSPDDLPTLNVLGDLYVRAARSDLAVPLYVRIADAYHREGFYSKAAGFCKKVLRFEPRDEGVLLRLAELSLAQKLPVDARTYFRAVATLREGRGDRPGTDEIAVRLGEIDRGDLETRVAAARALARLKGAVALDALRDAASDLSRAGREADALVILREIVTLDPQDREAMARVVRSCLEGGSLDEARAVLSRIDVGETPALLQLLTEIELATGRRTQARAAVEAWLASDSESGDAIVKLGCRWAPRDPDGGYACIEVVVDREVARANYQAAADVLEAFALACPNHVPALLRLVEVCVDGGFEEQLADAQAKLTDAYLEAGQAAEACVIAEDLVEREPENEAHRVRLARARGSLGQPEVRPADDAWPADVLSAVAFLDEEHSSSTQNTTSLGDSSALPPGTLTRPSTHESTQTAHVVEYSGPGAFDESMNVEHAQWRADGGAELPSPEPEPADIEKGPEVDLTLLLNALAGLGLAAAPASEHGGGAVDSLESVEPSHASDLDSVFAYWRAQALHGDEQSASQTLSLAETYLAVGLRHEARPLLENAARDPVCQARAARLLAKLHHEEGRPVDAITWLERAVDAQEADISERLTSLRELGGLLESVGEAARALAVWLEAQSLVPGDPEVEERVAQLSHAVPRGGESSAP